MIDCATAREIWGDLLLLTCLPGLLLCAFVVVIRDLSGFFQKHLVALWHRSRAQFTVLAILVAGATLVAQKTNNAPRNRNLSWRSLRPLRLDNGVMVTEDDIARGWRVESVMTNAAPFSALPSNAVEFARWTLRGGRETWFPLELGEFSIPIRTNRVRRLRVLSGGMVETFSPDEPSAICAAREHASLIPGCSRFRWADADDGSAKILRWEGVFANRDGTGEYDAEIRLFANGDFTTRSNEVETVCRRVNPDDWDDDGIPNDEDANPTDCDGDFFGPANVLPLGANSNAYCIVRVVALGPNALLTFTGDKPSSYPDPRFVAKAGVTNEVVILIGKTYAVSSDWPFAVIGVSDSETEVWQSDEMPWQAVVCRPVSISVSEGNPFAMAVSPSNLGGVFAWKPSTCSCMLLGAGVSFYWNCPTCCTCCGCSVDGTYAYEGYGLPATSGFCGCHYDGTGPKWEAAPAPLAASVTASFSKSAVIFEDAYENLPGQWVGRRSTRTRLNIVASGGPNGGTLSVARANLAKLTRISGPDLPLASVSVPAGTRVSYSIVYEGAEASAAMNDIFVSSLCVENGTGMAMSSTGTVTSIKVELSALNPAPANTNLHRHVYGVVEEFHYDNYPGDFQVDWSFFEGDEEHLPFSPGRMILPAMTNQHSNGLCEFRVAASGAYYTNNFSFLLPQISAGNPRCNENIQPILGEAGWLLLHLDLYVEPFYVSFKGLQMREIPDESGNCPHAGYYCDATKGGFLSHGAAAGAGVVNEVRADGYWATDRCGRAAGYETPWSDGWKEWPIPVGWGYGNSIMGQYNEPPTTQKFTLRENGTFSIKKYGIEAMRDILNNITLQGAQ